MPPAGLEEHIQSGTSMPPTDRLRHPLPNVRRTVHRVAALSWI